MRELQVLLHMHHKLVEAAQDGRRARPKVCGELKKRMEAPHLLIGDSVDQVRDVGMDGQPSGSKVGHRVGEAQPVLDEADKALYRMTDQAVDALAMPRQYVAMYDVAVMCNDCSCARASQA